MPVQKPKHSEFSSSLFTMLVQMQSSRQNLLAMGQPKQTVSWFYSPVWQWLCQRWNLISIKRIMEETNEVNMEVESDLNEPNPEERPDLCLDMGPRINKRYNCSLCNFTSETKRRILDHQGSEHGKYALHCLLCSFECSRQEYMNNHIKSTHLGVARKFKCSMCKVSTQYRYHLKHSCLRGGHRN